MPPRPDKVAGFAPEPLNAACAAGSSVESSGSQAAEGCILVAEDNPTNQLMVVRLLEQMGYQARAVDNGRLAVEVLRRHRCLLVLMDCQMPVMDGLAATRCIRAPDSGVLNPGIPIIALTARAISGDRELCLEAGMDDYLTKPISRPDLTKVLTRWSHRTHFDASGAAAREPTAAPQDSPSPSMGANQPSPVAGAPVFERQVFMDRIMSDPDLAKAVVDSFLGDMPLQMANLREAVAAGQSDVAGRVAHRIKGAAAVVAGSALREAALAMEHAGAASDPAALQANLPQVEEQFTLLLDALRAL